MTILLNIFYRTTKLKVVNLFGTVYFTDETIDNLKVKKWFKVVEVELKALE